MNTADDPTTLSSLPPRHALESDSEEDDDPAFPLPHSSRRQRTKPGPVELRITGWQSERDSATLLVLGGEAAGKFVDGYDGQDAGEVVRVDGVKEEIVRRLQSSSGRKQAGESAGADRLLISSRCGRRSGCCRPSDPTSSSSCSSPSCRTHCHRLSPLLCSTPSRPRGSSVVYPDASSCPTY